MLLTGVLKEGKNIFDEIRKSRGKSDTVSSRIDSVTGSFKIAENFANTYSKLYNRVDNRANLSAQEDTIENNVDMSSLQDLHRVD